MKPSKMIAIIGGALIGICGYVWCQASAAAAHNEGRQEMAGDIVHVLTDIKDELDREEKEKNEEVEG